VVDAFPDEELIAEVTAAHPIVMAYEAAREREAELAQADQLSDPLAGLLRAGAATSVADYTTARTVVAAAADRISRRTTGYDAILGPAAPGAAPLGLGATGDPVLSRAWQALGRPAVTVPGMRDHDGMPLGLQVIGAPGGELATLATACRVERALTDA
jgi:Asp-tRNA(Asn)/Glu-tRNA(Gln) amidotransferase A subunit family amidase